MNQLNSICRFCSVKGLLWLVVIFSVFLSSYSAWAAGVSDDGRRISGKVVDAAGEPIIGANVILVGGEVQVP